MNPLKFLEVPLWVIPFCNQINNLNKNSQCIFHVSSNDDKELLIQIIINKKILEITKSFNGKINHEILDVSKEGLKNWKDRKIKIKQLKIKAEISQPKNIIEYIAAQILIQKKYTKITSAERREIFRIITAFEKNFYKNNILDIDINMNLGKQNHWLD